MLYAHENKRFIDAVNEYVHIRLQQVATFSHGDPLDSIDHQFCSMGNRTTIKKVWFRCATENDFDEIGSILIEDPYGTTLELDLRIDDYFEMNLHQEMKDQISKLIDEKQRNGTRAA